MGTSSVHKKENKWENIKFTFPKDPLNTDFMKLWHETIVREDFKKLKEEMEKEHKEEIL